MNIKSWRHHLKTQIWKFSIISEITTRTSYCCHKTKPFMKKLIWNPTIKKIFGTMKLFTKSPYSGG